MLNKTREDSENSLFILNKVKVLTYNNSINSNFNFSSIIFTSFNSIKSKTKKAEKII